MLRDYLNSHARLFVIVVPNAALWIGAMILALSRMRRDALPPRGFDVVPKKG